MSEITVCPKCGYITPCNCERRITQRRADEGWEALVQGLRQFRDIVNDQVNQRLRGVFIWGLITGLFLAVAPMFVLAALLFEEPEIKVVDAIFAAFQ